MIRVFRWFSFESFTLVDPNNNCCSSRSLRFFGRIIAFCKGDFRFGFLLWTLYSVFHSAPAEGPLLAFAMKLFFFRRTAHLVRYPSGITAGTWSSLCVFAGFAVRSAHGARLFLQSCVRPERSPCARVPSVERRRTVPCTYLVSPTYGFFVPMYN